MSHIVITGGSGKVGSHIVRSLLDRNYNVTSISRSGKRVFSNEIFKELNEVKLDVTNENDFENLISIQNKRLGPVTGLINCCSYRPMSKGMDDHISKWKDSILQNSLSLFIPTRICIENMIKNKVEGSIITISSIYGIVAPRFDIYNEMDFKSEPDYSYNKSAAVGFTKYIASYYSKNKIRANIIAPGGFFNNQPKEFVANYSRNTLLGRMAEGDDISGVIKFLLSNDSKYITGSVISMDGGWTCV